MSRTFKCPSFDRHPGRKLFDRSARFDTTRPLDDHQAKSDDGKFWKSSQWRAFRVGKELSNRLDAVIFHKFYASGTASKWAEKVGSISQRMLHCLGKLSPTLSSVVSSTTKRRSGEPQRAFLHNERQDQSPCRFRHPEGESRRQSVSPQSVVE